MKKLYILFMSVLLALASLPVRVLAAENGAFLEGYASEEGKLKIYCSDIVQEEENAQGVEVSLGGQGLTVVSVESEKDARTPVTYYCLADVSGSMGAEQMAQAREAVLAVVDGMKDGDNMVVGTLGNRTETSGFLTDREALRGVVSSLEAGREDTNLYAGIVESIRVLRADTSVNPRRCLIILSDGEDDQKTGITRDEAAKAVTDSSIPVYTVATLKNAGDEESVSNAKLLGSFARTSTGGAYFAPVLDESTGEQAGQSIVRGMEAGFVVNVKLPVEMPDKDEALLRMVYKSADNTVYEDTLTVYTEDLGRGAGGDAKKGKAQEPTPKPATEPAQEPAPEPVLEDPEPGHEAYFPWVAVAVVALLVIIVLIIVLVRKGHKRNGEEQAGERPEDASDGEVLWGTDDVPPTGSAANPQKKAAPGYELRLYAIGYSDIVRTIRLEQGRKVTVGRNDKADVILDREDKKLSGIQCGMLWEDGKLYVWDMDSTNGTFVNGIPIKSMGRVVVHDGETIRMGSYEYRVGRR